MSSSQRKRNTLPCISLICYSTLVFSWQFLHTCTYIMNKSPHYFSILRKYPKNSVQQRSNCQVCHCVKQRAEPRTELFSALFQECIFTASSCSASEENHFPRACLWRFCEPLSPISATVLKLILKRNL